MEKESPVLVFGHRPVNGVHSHKYVRDCNGLSISVLLLPSRMKSLSTGKLRDVPPSIVTSGKRMFVVKFAEDITVVDWMFATQVIVYDNPGLNESDGITSALPSVLIGIAVDIVGVMDQM